MGQGWTKRTSGLNKRELSQLLIADGGGLEAVAELAGVLFSWHEAQITLVAMTAATRMAAGMQNRSNKTAISPFTFNLKTPKVKMQAVASQIVQVEMVLESSLFIVFLP